VNRSTHALEGNSQRIRTARELDDPLFAEASRRFLLVGPAASEKDRDGLALSDLLYGGEQITAINMSEFQEAHTVSTWKGSPRVRGLVEGGAFD
jgi:type VI secretion system protein VasG